MAAKTETESAAAEPAVAKSPKEVKPKPKVIAAAGNKKPKKKASYPSIPKMVDASLKELNERSGSSVHAIRKYIGETYKADSDTVYLHIKKYLRNAVIDGKLIQTRGHGAYGSFRLPSKKKLAAAKKMAGGDAKPKSPKKAAAKKKSDAKKLKVVVKKVAASGGVKKGDTKVVSKKPVAAKTAKPIKAKPVLTTKKVAVQKQPVSKKQMAAKAKPVASAKRGGTIKFEFKPKKARKA